jgi:hypothetical protein
MELLVFNFIFIAAILFAPLGDNLTRKTYGTWKSSGDTWKIEKNQITLTGEKEFKYKGKIIQDGNSDRFIFTGRAEGYYIEDGNDLCRVDTKIILHGYVKEETLSTECIIKVYVSCLYDDGGIHLVNCSGQWKKER